MTKSETAPDLKVLDDLRAALASAPKLGPAFRADRLRLDADGVLIFEAEADTVAQKKIALETAAAFPQVAAIVDRVRVTPADPMGDAEIRAHLRLVYTQDPALAGLAIREVRGGLSHPVAAIADAHGTLEYEVVDGVVILNGAVPGLTVKRYVGVLAWWVPGSRDVVNGIEVVSDEADHADKIAEAVHLVLEKNPYLDASQIKVGVRERVVRLTGYLPSEGQREMAENDAWCVFGVDKVINEIEVGR